MKVLVRSACLAMLLFAHPAWSDECEVAHDPPPRSTEATGINFYNDTQYAMKIFKTDNEGFLTETGLVQPMESREYKTFVGHSWFVEMYAPDRTECFGPITPNETESCEAHMLWDDGIGIDAGFCDF